MRAHCKSEGMSGLGLLIYREVRTASADKSKYR